MHPVLVRLIGAAGCLFALSVATAQDASRHTVEISALGRQTANESSYVAMPPASYTYVVHEQIFGGVLAGYSFSLSPRFALEARTGYLFGRQIQVPQNGGEQFLAHAGIRATVPLGRSRYALSARIAPGISSFSSGLRSQDFTLVVLNPSGVFTYTSVPHYGRITHFSLEEGIGLSARLSHRTSLHIDVSDETLLQGDRRQTFPQQAFSNVVENASVEDHALVSVGLSRSFGRSFKESPQSPSEAKSLSAPQNELIISYALQPTINIEQNDLGLPSGAALTGSHFLYRWLALDSSIILLRGGDTYSTFQDGGGQLQFFSGIKFGLQRSRYGVYGKVRPGLISFHKGLENLALVPPPTDIVNQFGGDAGAVFELYPSRHFLLRFDLGETLIHYSAVTPVNGYGSNFDPARNAGAPQFLLGAGCRF
jgi:hypothetical protein